MGRHLIRCRPIFLSIVAYKQKICYICDMLDAFIKHIQIERRYSPLTIRNYRKDIEIFEAWLQSSESVTQWPDVELRHLRSWVLFRSEECGLKPSTVNRELSSIRAFFSFLLKQRAITKDITQQLTALKTPQRLPTFIAQSRMQGVIEDCNEAVAEDDFEQQRDSLLIMLFYCCGVRLAEMVGVDRDDFMDDFTSLRVRGKGNKERVVPIIEPLRESIIAHIATICRQNICTSQQKALFLTKNGERISRTAIYRAVQERLRLSGVQGKASPHVLRHTFATLMMNSGADMRHIQELLGHTSLQATQVYTHNSISRLLEVYNKSHPREGGKLKT